MSRTFRRNKKHLIDSYVGTREEISRYPHWLMYRYPTCTFEQAYERSLARFTRDQHPGHFGVPRWFRRFHGSKSVRLRERQELHRCLRQQDWDDHLSDSRCRDAKWYWY